MDQETRMRALMDESESSHLSPDYRGKKYKAKGRKRGPSGRGHMAVGDPLFEMLPSPEKLQSMQWYPREVYKFPPAMRSIGVQDSLSISSTKIIRQFLFDERKSQCDRQGRNRFLQILVNLAEIATKKTPQSIAAATLLFDRAGITKPQAEDEAPGRKGIQVVFVKEMQGDIPVEQPPVETMPPPQLPEFIDAEFKESQ